MLSSDCLLVHLLNLYLIFKEPTTFSRPLPTALVPKTSSRASNIYNPFKTYLTPSRTPTNLIKAPYNHLLDPYHFVKNPPTRPLITSSRTLYSLLKVPYNFSKAATSLWAPMAPDILINDSNNLPKAPTTSPIVYNLFNALEISYQVSNIKASYNILKNSYNLIKESLNIFKVPCTTSQEPPQKTPQYIAVKLDHASGLQAYMLTVLLLIGNAGVSYCFVTG